ncbi:MAG: AhpC/TSA family protein [Prevotella sp.]|nr:AhpC/TSA family protein [Prevotella sp.]
MNKKTIITALLALATMTGQAQEEREYNISGFVPDGIEKVYLYKTEGLGSRVFLDSVTVADGKFAMKGNRPAYDLVSLGNKGLHNIMFFVDGEPMTVDFANDTLRASTLNEKFQGYMAEDKVFTDNFYRLFMASKKAESEAEKNEIEQQIAANNEAMIEQARRFIRENRDNVIAAYFLQLASGYMDFEELSAAIDSTAYYFNHPLMNEAKQRLQVLLLRQVGKPLTDLTLEAPDGQSHQLSEWCGQGKYVLIDFWASWCRPCRMEMPNVIQNYERFRDRGFEVIAVSIDDKKSAWLRGIKDFGTPFVQLSDLKGRNSELATIYGISTIPANLLVDPQGKIIAADLRGKVLTKKLEEIFKSK